MQRASRVGQLNLFRDPLKVYNAVGESRGWVLYWKFRVTVHLQVDIEEGIVLELMKIDAFKQKETRTIFATKSS